MRFACPEKKKKKRLTSKRIKRLKGPCFVNYSLTPDPSPPSPIMDLHLFLIIKLIMKQWSLNKEDIVALDHHHRIIDHGSASFSFNKIENETLLSEHGRDMNKGQWLGWRGCVRLGWTREGGGRCGWQRSWQRRGWQRRHGDQATTRIGDPDLTSNATTIVTKSSATQIWDSGLDGG